MRSDIHISIVQWKNEINHKKSKTNIDLKLGYVGYVSCPKFACVSQNFHRIFLFFSENDYMLQFWRLDRLDFETELTCRRRAMKHVSPIYIVRPNWIFVHPCRVSSLRISRKEQHFPYVFFLIRITWFKRMQWRCMRLLRSISLDELWKFLGCYVTWSKGVCNNLNNQNPKRKWKWN